jgi:hypothetical protein
MMFKIFSNDRGKVGGVPMYSALCSAFADDRASAQREASTRFRDFGPVKAIEWPMTSQASKDWCVKHVGPMKGSRGRAA